MPTSPGEYKKVSITPGTDAEVAQQVASIDSGSAMGVDQMKNPVTAPPVIPTPTPLTGTTGLLGTIESNTDTFTKNLAAGATAAEKARTDSFDELIKSLSDTPGREELKDSIYNQNVDPLAKDLNDINDQIRGEQHSLLRQTQKLDLNEHGMLAGALSDAKSDLEKKSLAKQADLSIIQLSRQGKYDSAKEIADRAGEVMFEKETQKNNLLQLAYEENKSLFTTAEQRLFDTQQKDRERKLDFEQEKQMAQFNLTLEKEKALYDHSLSGGGSGSHAFTTTQRNIGASNAGLSIDEFNSLPDDDKNYFVNSYDSFQSELKKVQSGDQSAQDLIDYIDTSNLSDNVKKLLKSQVGPVDSSGGGGGLWNSLKGWLGI